MYKKYILLFITLQVIGEVEIYAYLFLITTIEIIVFKSVKSRTIIKLIKNKINKINIQINKDLSMLNSKSLIFMSK